MSYTLFLSNIFKKSDKILFINRKNFLVTEYLTNHRRNFCLTTTLDAGHSKWQNIKHTKLSKDAQKSQLYNRLILKIRVALKSQGGSDPHLNKDFADVLEMCRKANMPNTTIDKAVKRVLEKKTKPVKIEILGPENSLLVIDADVENPNQFRTQIRLVLKKYVGFGFAKEGRAVSAFSEKGVVRVKNTNGNSEFNMNNAEEIAIQADAEEVQINKEDNTILMFIGDQFSHIKVKKYIENNHKNWLIVVEDGLELIPYVRNEVSEEVAQTLADVIDELGELEGVNRVYNNVFD